MTNPINPSNGGCEKPREAGRSIYSGKHMTSIKIAPEKLEFSIDPEKMELSMKGGNIIIKYY